MFCRWFRFIFCFDLNFCFLGSLAIFISHFLTAFAAKLCFFSHSGGIGCYLFQADWPSMAVPYANCFQLPKCHISSSSSGLSTRASLAYCCHRTSGPVMHLQAKVNRFHVGLYLLRQLDLHFGGLVPLWLFFARVFILARSPTLFVNVLVIVIFLLLH